MVDSVSQKLVAQFKEFLGKLSTLEESLQKSINEYDTKLKEVSIAESTLKSEQKSVSTLQLSLQSKLEDYNSKISSLESKADSLKRLEESIKDRQIKLDDAAKSLQTEREALNQDQQSVKKREAYMEMQERRFKLFEHQLNLIAQDEKVKEKLKEIS